MKKLTLFLIAALSLVGETSVFDNKSIESKKVYGFSETEQYIYDNKKDIDSIRSRLYRAEEKLNTIDTSTSGYSAIIRGNSQKLSEATKNINSFIFKLENIQLLIGKLENQVSDISLSLEKIKNDEIKQEGFNKIVQENDIKFEKKTVEILNLLDELKKTTVKNDELKKIVQQLLDELEKNKKDNDELKKAIKFSSPELFFKSKEPKDILSEAFAYIKKRNYDEARVRLFFLLNNTDYQRARVLYNIGELEYKQKNYKDAVESFKASGALDNKASYMPILLYHAGICYENIKDTANAIKFYNTLISLYPKSNLIKGAKNRVKRLSK